MTSSNRIDFTPLRDGGPRCGAAGHAKRLDVVMRRSAALVLLGILAPCVMADEPLPAPATHVVCSSTVRYCVVLDPETDGVAYELDTKTFCGTELWRVKGWHRSGFISEDGEHFVSGYDGLELLSQEDARAETVMLRIYRKGELVEEVTLRQLVPNLSELRRTASHYYWGHIVGFPGLDWFLEIELVGDRSATVDVRTGEVKVYQ